MSVVHARCIAHAFDSKNAIQYWPGLDYDLDLADKDQRKLVWLRTPRGKWIFDFDRANSSDTTIRMFFCKECGQPFDKLNDIGTHKNQYHNNNEKANKIAKEDNEAEIEAMLLEQRVKEESGTGPGTVAERFAQKKQSQVSQ